MPAAQQPEPEGRAPARRQLEMLFPAAAAVAAASLHRHIQPSGQLRTAVKKITCSLRHSLTLGQNVPSLHGQAFALGTLCMDFQPCRLRPLV